MCVWKDFKKKKVNKIGVLRPLKWFLFSLKVEWEKWRSISPQDSDTLSSSIASCVQVLDFQKKKKKWSISSGSTLIQPSFQTKMYYFFLAGLLFLIFSFFLKIFCKKNNNAQARTRFPLFSFFGQSPTGVFLHNSSKILKQKKKKKEKKKKRKDYLRHFPPLTSVHSQATLSSLVASMLWTQLPAHPNPNPGIFNKTFEVKKRENVLKRSEDTRLSCTSVLSFLLHFCF